jgi:acyl-CoA synthetase (NDP forming)
LQTKNDLQTQLDFAFYPKSVAVIGTTATTALLYNAGNLFFRTVLEFGFPGKLYAVGKSGGELLGHKIYPSVLDIPDELDYVIVAIPNRFLPQLAEECGQKGVKIMHLFVSGFGEIEDKSGLVLQDEMLRIAHKYNIRIIGPNCMGVYCPGARLTMAINFSETAGTVAYMAQSGGQCIMGVREANQRGIYFSKVISYGNAADINECDLIEYFTADPETDIITVYIEGTNDGPRLFRALKEAISKKPVVVFKCAATEGGTHAAVSHTSAIAGSNLTWDSLLRQSNVIRVYSAKEMFDVVTLLKRCPPPKGLSTLVVGHGGGSCVQASDDCCRSGLNMPLLTQEMRQGLMNVYLTDAGNIFKNPLDINPFFGLDKAREAFKVVADWERADAVVFVASPEQTPFVPREFEYKIQTNTLMELARMTTKPSVIVLNMNTVSQDDGWPEKSFKRLIDQGFAAFPTVERAAMALNRVYQYYQRRKKHNV